MKIKPVQDSDLELLKIWLNKEHILKYYHDANEWLMEIRERNDSFSFLKHFIVFVDDKPIGFCQYYDCFDAKELWYTVEVPNKVFSIDYFIGEELYLRKGYGKEIVKTLVDTIRELGNAAQIIVQPEMENIASCKALLSNEFTFDESKQYFTLLLS